MFDVGFWELVILFGLGLIILGPERLPKVAMKVGNWVGQARRMARQLSSQIRDEINDIDVEDPFSSTSTSRATPNYNRPGVDDLKPSAAGDESPTDEESHTSSPDADDPAADSLR
jgi:Tat protein translocase TatB subunit